MKTKTKDLPPPKLPKQAQVGTHPPMAGGEQICVEQTSTGAVARGIFVSCFNEIFTSPADTNSRA